MHLKWSSLEILKREEKAMKTVSKSYFQEWLSLVILFTHLVLLWKHWNHWYIVLEDSFNVLCISQEIHFWKNMFTNSWYVCYVFWHDSFLVGFLDFLSIFFVIRIYISNALRNLVPFAQFKVREKHSWMSATFIKLTGFRLQIY